MEQLERLEEGREDELPGPVLVKGFDPLLRADPGFDADGFIEVLDGSEELTRPSAAAERSSQPGLRARADGLKRRETSDLLRGSRPDRLAGGRLCASRASLGPAMQFESERAGAVRRRGGWSICPGRYDAPMRGTGRLHDLARVASSEPRPCPGRCRTSTTYRWPCFDVLDASVQDVVLVALGCSPAWSARAYAPEAAASLVARIAPEQAAALLEELELDDVTDILQQLDPERLRDLLSRLDPEDIEEVEELLTYDPSSAGGLMTPETVSVPDEVTVAEALRIVQETQDLPDQVFYVYVVDEDERLVGVTSLRMLVTRGPDLPIREVMRTSLVSVSVDTDQEEVAHIVSRYDVVSVPVVDAQGCCSAWSPSMTWWTCSGKRPPRTS